MSDTYGTFRKDGLTRTADSPSDRTRFIFDGWTEQKRKPAEEPDDKPTRRRPPA